MHIFILALISVSQNYTIKYLIIPQPTLNTRPFEPATWMPKRIQNNSKPKRYGIMGSSSQPYRSGKFPFPPYKEKDAQSWLKKLLTPTI